MKLLHKIFVGGEQLLILKNERKTPYMGHLIGVNINFPLEVNMYLDSRDESTEQHIKEMEEMHIDCAIPVIIQDELVAYYVHFIDEEPRASYPDLKQLNSLLRKELQERLFCKYLVVKKSRVNREETSVNSIEGVQQLLDKLRLPFEFTVDEELCLLHKLNKVHTKRRVFARCKYYKNKEGEYVIMQKFPDKIKEKIHQY